MNTRIGLIGCGRWGRYILRDLLQLGCEVHVADPDPIAQSNALTAGAHEVVSALEQLLQDLDGYVVAVPTISHFEVVHQMMDWSRPIFCEKPLTIDVQQANLLAERLGDRLFLMDKWRYHPGVERLRQLAGEGTLGSVQFVRTRRVQWGQPHTDVDAVWILAPHDLSIVFHILGELPTPRAAFGEFAGDRMESMMAFLGTTPGATIEVSARHPIPGRLISVTFERGVALLDDPLADAIQVFRYGNFSTNPAIPDRIPIATEFPLLRELRHFRDYLHGGAPPLTNAVEAAKMVAAIAAMRQLARG